MTAAELRAEERPRIVIYLELLPPSTNNLFASVGRRRVPTAAYTTWRRHAGQQIMVQRLKRAVRQIAGPYEVHILAGRSSMRRDIDNIIKPCVDLLVSMGVTEDDSNCVAVSARWGEVEGVVVEIESAG